MASNVIGTSKSSGLELYSKNRRIIRIGYDLFREVQFLLSTDQQAHYSQIPTLEIHISMLRYYIISSGIPLIEIPPVPTGYHFITCLTHDVDFIKLRSQKINLTTLGFIYRGFLRSFFNFLKMSITIKKLIKNWLAVLKLPCVYLGIVRDYFDQFGRYVEVEKNLRSTFFIIPFKNYAGRTSSGFATKKRACNYDITDIKDKLHWLLSNNCEIGLHGIDAWMDSQRGKSEYAQLTKIIRKKKLA